MYSMYRALVHPEVSVDDNKTIWKMKIPLKVKIFTWYTRKTKEKHVKQIGRAHV